MDKLTREQRQKCMSKIGSRDTKPELELRKMVYKLGFRYRLYCSNLPGRPDLVFTKRKKVIFMHGCFWHRHTCNLGKPKPKTNEEFWIKKFSSNIRRDAENLKKLQGLGWETLIIWQCELNDKRLIVQKISEFLSSQ